jgi:hypothetical protein
VLGLVVTLAWVLVPRGTAATPPVQPVQYSHAVHAEGRLGVPCTKCHEGAEHRERAGYPPDVFCAACHSAPQGDSPEEAKLTELLQAGTPLAWQQVTRIASHVFFSHRRHVAAGNTECAACHGDMAARTVPIDAPVVNFTGRAGMLRCIACHKESGSPYAGVSCVDCHR